MMCSVCSVEDCKIVFETTIINSLGAEGIYYYNIFICPQLLPATAEDIIIIILYYMLAMKCIDKEICLYTCYHYFL